MPIPSHTPLRRALKEWEGVVRAMRDGKHFLLLAGAADRDPDREARFVIRDLEFFLLPVRDGQERHAIRPEFQAYLDGPPENDGGSVEVTARAVVTDTTMIMDGRHLRGLGAFHIWTEEHLSGRVRWDPKDPLFLLTCKVAKVEPAFRLPWRAAYDGRDPWVTLAEPELPAATYEPVVPHKDYLKIGLDVKAILAERQKNPIEPPPGTQPAAAPPAPPPPAPAAT
jgi:hypothetical protein